jgi:hypothetical protein
MRSMRGWISILVLGTCAGLGCASSQGGSRQATPPVMNAADPFWTTAAQPTEAPDSDHDGVLDADDRCPMAIEDKDGFEDGDGCPEPDNDADGIDDAADQCPNEPETMNGYDDRDGCPDFADPLGPLWCYERARSGAAADRMCKTSRDDCEAARAVADRKASKPCVEEGAK